MDKNEDQFSPDKKKIHSTKIISNLDMTRKRKDTGEPVAKVTISREKNLLHQEGTPHPVAMQGPDRMSGVGKASEMGKIFKSIAAMKPKDN